MIQPSSPLADAVIFDMDGLLFDTEREWYECYEIAAKEHGFVDGIRDASMIVIGTTSAATQLLFHERFGQTYPFEKIEARTKELRSLRRESKGIPIKTGVHEVVTFLQRRDLPFVIASSSRRESIELNLKITDLHAHFEHMIGGDEVEHGKPEPEIFLKAAEKLGVRPERCVVLEDSVNGILAAFRAGTIPILIPDLVDHPPESIARAHRVFPSLLDVREYFVKVL